MEENIVKNDIVIIGLGGIGSVLSNNIVKYIDSISKDPVNINLIDGDEYEPKNLDRQEFVKFGNKAEVKAFELKMKYPRMSIEGHPYFIDNISISKLIKDGDTIFLAVDNHKTRKIVSDYVCNFKDVVLISGGNELTDGNVQIFIRKDNKNITPSLTDYHPEIKNPRDKLPSEMSCEELMNSEPQIFFTNLGVATFMSFAYFNVLKGNYKFSEVYFDMNSMKSDSKIRNIKK